MAKIKGNQRALNEAIKAVEQLLTPSQRPLADVSRPAPLGHNPRTQS